MSNNPIQILVLLREANDPKPPARLNPDGYTVREHGLRRIVSPADLCALEQGLQLAKEQKGQLTAIAIGPQRLDDHLRLALSMGVARGIRVWDSVLAGGDVAADAQLLTRIYEILQPDLILTGNRMADRGNDPVPVLAAANRGIPYVTAALRVDCCDGEVEVLRKADRGARQRVGTRTPCLLQFEDGCCEPHYPDQAGLMAALHQTIETWGLAELGLSANAVGSAAALLGKERCSFPRANPQRVVTPDANLPAFERILALLSGGIKPREGKLHRGSAEETAEQLLKIFQSEGLLGGRKP